MLREADTPDFQGWFDFHCHFCDIVHYDCVDLSAEIKAANSVGVKLFFSGAYNREQFTWHSEYFQGSRGWHAGIHPMFVDETVQDLELVEDLAVRKQISAIGEIGLDSRYNTAELQTRAFLQQLEISRHYDLPVIIHCVGKYYDVYKLIKTNFPGITGILHGFSSSNEVFQMFSSLGFGFSLGAIILKSRNNGRVLKNIIKWGCYVTETDAPAQKPYFAGTEFNKLSYLPEIASEIARIADIDLQAFQAQTWKTLLEFGFKGM